LAFSVRREEDSPVWACYSGGAERETGGRVICVQERLTRRKALQQFLWTSAIAATGVGFPSSILAEVAGPVVQTTNGRVQGGVNGGVQVFKGIPYGGSTAGRNRFRPPTRPEPWSGVRTATRYGPRAPQPAENPSSAAPQGEDCLVLNVWTPELGSDSKRPVMIWLHGGGFQSGSGDSPVTDGTNLAKVGNVVVVSLNHRLNALGFLYLGEFDKEFAFSGNVGMLDLIAAFHWVQENIAAFGGDPGNVTIFGESGGAGKVSALMGMPSAKGLFHRAICESGAMPRNMPVGTAIDIASQFLEAVGVKQSEVSRLQEVPAERLISAYSQITPYPFSANAHMMWQPVVDGRTLPAQPFDTIAPSCSAAVPMLIGTNKSELSLFFAPDKLTSSNLQSEVMETIRLSDKDSTQIIGAFQRTRPSDSPYDLFIAICSDAIFRNPSIAVAELKARQSVAPAYMYLLEWDTNARGGYLHSPHSLDLPLVFRNLDEKMLTGSDDRRFELSDKMSKAWVAFAHSGNPNHSSLPGWDAYSEDQRATMIFDNDCKLVDDPRREDRLAIRSIPPYYM
jgi:para-nitrobenzyl esterase